MSFKSRFLRIGLFSFAMMLMSVSFSYGQDSEFSFKAVNKTDVKIVKLMVSQDGKKWGFFDIGSGIAAGATAKLVWSKETDNENCNNWVKVVYADKSESKPAKFDFCEDDLVLEFDD